MFNRLANFDSFEVKVFLGLTSETKVNSTRVIELFYLQELSKTTPDVYFYKVNVDECEDLAQEYDVKAMPTFVFIKKGKAVS